MSAASSPGPQNLILLAALGVGAYWFMTRRAAAASPAAAAATASAPKPAGSNTAGKIDAAGRLIGGLVGLFGGSSSSNNGTYDGRSAQPWDVTPSGSSGPAFNNPSAYVAAGLDGLAANPVYSSPYDYGQYF
jgi:hypothetical protein